MESVRVSSVIEYHQAFMSYQNATQLEKPRYVILLCRPVEGMSCHDVSVFDDLSNLKVYLYSEFYPYDDLNLDFDKKRYAI